MKKSRSKIIALLITILMLLTIIQMPVKAETKDHTILKKADKEFIIYFEDICNNEFKFAFSKTKNVKEDSLKFTNAAKDQLNKNASYVAYLNDSNFNQAVSDYTTYIWIKDAKSKTIISGEKVNLNDALDEKKVELVNTTTKRIDTDVSKTESKNEKIDDVDTTITTGKIVINPKRNATYSYQLIKLTDDFEEANELFNLAQNLNEYGNNTYENLSKIKKFYNLYENLLPTIWTDVDDYEILQPDGAKEGDKYIAFIKENERNSSVIDAKFLVCKYKEDSGVKEDTKTITETVKLPVTYDSIALIVFLAVIIFAIVTVLILKMRLNKKEKIN